MYKNRIDVLPVAARTANTAIRPIVARYTASLRLYLNVSAVSGTGGIYPVVRGYDPYGGVVELTNGGDAITQTGVYAYEMNSLNTPSDAVGSIREVTGRSVPYQFDVLVKHLDASSYTYALTVEMVDDD